MVGQRKRSKMSKIIAIDLGGTFLRSAIVKGNKIINYTKVKTPKTKSLLLKELINSISNLMDKDVKGIGIACPGPLSNGIIRNPPNLALQNFNLQKFIQNKFHKKTKVKNDANCVALAESKYGVKKKNFIIMTLGTGIGGGIIINGKLYVGEQSYASEFGHLVNNGKYLEKIWQARGGINYVSQGIGSLINIFDPEIVVLTGGVKDKVKLLKQIKQQTKKYIYIPNKSNIIWSKLKHPGILGASLLVK